MLHSLPSPITKKPKVRVGRGSSSGHGSHTTGRGVKGQKSRTGYKRPRPGFEGGQMPLSRRLPKLKGFSRGFVTANTQVYNLQLSLVAEVIEGELVNLETLAESGLVNPSSKKVTIKILFDEPISKKLIIEGIDISKNAREAVEKVGGEVR